ncbi:armadillo-type protein [Neohortaea acidophila]|uniref:Armadillo-type protein n=1 Tax=Neohortaea acidophila TaxID=245834 RepID=A0A6A6PIG7_9PEZI|nr:armadillo-type protein [Neohortaea acidophila]KAF2479501.1 armadillo-type protein [Neohortaea acidophila]
MGWQPQPEPLGQLTLYLRDSFSGHDAAAQKNAEQMLKQAKESPDIINYLTFICVTSANPTEYTKEIWHAARSAGALLLKNSVKTSYKSISEDNQSYMKLHLPAGLQDPNAQIRNFVGNAVTEIVRQGGVVGWPDIIPSLVSVLESAQASADAQDGAMSTLFKICEDNKAKLDEEQHNSPRPLAFLLPKLLQFTTSPDAKIRWRALSAVNVFLTDPAALTAKEHIDEILPRIIHLVADSSEDVRRFVCRSFALIADAMPNVLIPHVQGIVDYTLSQQTEIQNQELALDAAEFFFEASSAPALRDALGPYLDRIVPVLLDSMIYSEDDQLRLEGDEDDADTEDKEEEIRPQFATAKSARSGVPDAPSTSANGRDKPSINGYAYEDDGELSDGEIEEDEDFDIDPEDEWNLRKCSAAALDSLALHFGAPVFGVTIPWLMNNLQHKDWQNREAAVLALGAIGPGCMDEIKPHLPQLIPYMTTLLDDQQPVVRQITCWALSRFAGWASQLEPAPKQQLFEPMMDGILQRMLDHNKKVQESAASAFATLEEAAKTELAPYCQIILQQFVKCFGRYKDKNTYLLYDCVQTLAEHAGPTLAQPELVNLLMPALIARWQKVPDGSREMFPLLECLAFVATALGAEFAPFAEPIFLRCIKIIQQNLEESANADSEWLDQPDKDFLVTSLDLVSSMIQVLSEQQSTALANSAKPNVFELVAYCMKDVNNDVKQSAYALLGDCAIYLFPLLQPYLPTILELLINQLDLDQANDDPETAFRVINNACWSCGEIAMRQGPGMSPYIDRLLQKLAIIMFNDTVPESLNENSAIALGRLGIGCHQQLAPHLQNFALPFLKSMQKVGWTDEKGHAYKGFGQVVLDNPQALENGLLDFFMEMANAPGIFLTGMQDEGPLKVFEKVLVEYKRLIGGNFDDFLHHLPAPQEQALRQLYVF